MKFPFRVICRSKLSFMRCHIPVPLERHKITNGYHEKPRKHFS